MSKVLWFKPIKSSRKLISSKDITISVRKSCVAITFKNGTHINFVENSASEAPSYISCGFVEEDNQIVFQKSDADNGYRLYQNGKSNPYIEISKKDATAFAILENWEGSYQLKSNDKNRKDGICCFIEKPRK